MLTGSEQALYALFTRIAAIDQFGRAMVERTLPPSVTLAQLAVLGELSRADAAMTPIGLARSLGVTKQTMTTTLARLARAGLISIAPDPADRRMKRISLTPQGTQVQESSLQRLGPEIAMTADHLPAGLIARLTPSLAELQRALDRATS